MNINLPFPAFSSILPVDMLYPVVASVYVGIDEDVSEGEMLGVKICSLVTCEVAELTTSM